VRPASNSCQKTTSWSRLTDKISARSYFDQVVGPAPATLHGLLAIMAPIGSNEIGLPIGIQLIDGSLDDRTTIAPADMVEREFGGFRPLPMLWATGYSAAGSTRPLFVITDCIEKAGPARASSN
jgi:Asp-tRNA(Asn)/Glu-tRNA(Gln) amidotransferase A subunit family amidase